MQLNKILRIFLITLPMITISSCNTNKDVNGHLTNVPVSNSINTDSGNASWEEQERLQIQELQKDNAIYFELDKYEIRPEYAQILDEHANFLRHNVSYKITVEGHTDERGTPEYNIALGERRANSVKNYLQGKGVLDDQISIVSYGKSKPAVLNHDDEAYAKNRRAVLIY